MEFIQRFASLPKWARIVLVLLVGLIPAIHRIYRYTETRNENTLIVGVLCVVPLVGGIIQIIDAISIGTENRITVAMD